MGESILVNYAIDDLALVLRCEGLGGGGIKLLILDGSAILHQRTSHIEVEIIWSYLRMQSIPQDVNKCSLDVFSP
jgi:hypothetical protein